MRLTLRTLLAYLDDQLAPAEAKEIGAKLQDAPAARALADRAKESIRRRRLGVPGDPTAGGDAAAAAPSGPVPDPNEVAAYLDNALPPDRVAAVEQACLDDDAALAEVAACHQILTQVLSEPARVRPATLARLKALAPAADPSADGPPPPPPASVGPAARPAPAKVPDAGRSFESGLPEHLRTSRRGWGWVPWVAALGLGGLWLGSLAMDDDLFGPADPAGRLADLDPGAAGFAPGEGPAVAPAVPGPADAPTEPAVPDEPAVDPDEAARLAATLPLDPPPPEQTPRAGAPESPAAGGAAEVASAEGESPTPGEGEMSPADSGASPGAPADADAADAAPPAAGAPRVTLAGGRGLHAFDPDRGGFYAVEQGAAVPAGVPLLVPGPLRAELAVEGLPVGVELPGGTRAALGAGPAGIAPLSIAVEAGRVRLTGGGGPGGGGAGGGNTAVVLTAGGAGWAVAPSAGASAGLLVTPRLPRGAEAEVRGNPVAATLFVAGGPATVTDLAPGSPREPVELPAGTASAVVTDAGVLAAPAAGSVALDPAAGVPDWVAGADPTRADAMRADQFAEALAPGQPLTVTLPPLADADREIPARQAVEAMALAGEAGDLARAMKRTPHPTVVLAAADGLRSMLGRTPGGDAAVRDAIAREFPPEVRLELSRLLDRLSDAEARDPGVGGSVVGLLESDQLAVRTLAIDELERLAGVTHSFRPLDSAGSRASAVRRWRTHLQRVGAILDPDAAREEAGTPGDAAADAPPPADPADATGVDFGGLIPDDL